MEKSAPAPLSCKTLSTLVPAYRNDPEGDANCFPVIGVPETSTGRPNSPFSLRYSLSIRHSLKRFGFESSKLIPRLNATSNRHVSKQEKQNLIITKENLASAGKVICCCYS